MRALSRTSACLAIAIATVLVALLAGCGGDDATTDSATSVGATSPAATTQGQGYGDRDGDDGSRGSSSTPSQGSDAEPRAGGAASAKAPGEAGSPAQRRRAEARERKVYERERYGEPSQQSAPFAKYSGPASEGKMHLAEFGQEADDAERAAAQEALESYLRAQREGDLGTACGYLLSETRAQLEAMAKSAKDGGSGCAAALRLGLRLASAGGEPYFGSASVVSLRIEKGGPAGDGAGFALFHGDDGHDYWAVMKARDGQWKVSALVPQQFR